MFAQVTVLFLGKERIVSLRKLLIIRKGFKQIYHCFIVRKWEVWSWRNYPNTKCIGMEMLLLISKTSFNDTLTVEKACFQLGEFHLTFQNNTL